MLDRRVFGVSTLILAGLATREASAQQSATAPSSDGFAETYFRQPVADVEASVPTGNGPTAGVDVCKAFRIMMKAPHDIAPIDIASYFSKDETKSETAIPGTDGKKQRLFREEWPTPGPANPLIVGFFAATQLLPSGDQTAWCAAFVNLCLWSAGLQGTASASSQSFKPLVKIAANSPVVTGNLAVFSDLKDGQPNGFGHVTFAVHPDDVMSGKYRARQHALDTYKADPNGHIFGLGGNQGGGEAGSSGGVKVAALPRSSASRRFLGYVDIGSFKAIPAA